jgi:hypothetical protein
VQRTAPQASGKTVASDGLLEQGEASRERRRVRKGCAGPFVVAETTTQKERESKLRAHSKEWLCHEIHLRRSTGKSAGATEKQKHNDRQCAKAVASDEWLEQGEGSWERHR